MKGAAFFIYRGNPKQKKCYLLKPLNPTKRSSLVKELILAEYKLYEKHVTGCAAEDGNEHVSLPKVEKGGDGDADEFGQSMKACGKLNIFQTVDNEHSENGGRQDTAQIMDVGRRILASENQKWQEAGKCRAKH